MFHVKQFGQNKAAIAAMIRVNQAGEYAANQIYSAQIKYTDNAEDKVLLTHMLEQEEEHLRYFDEYMVQNRVRPTMMQPIWRVLSYGMGAATAKLGREAAMMCTEAVEEVIDEHYQSQLEVLGESELKQKIEQFRQEELEHKHIAIENDAAKSPMYGLLSGAIKFSCRAAIAISKRI